ncbi:MAG TPA: 16S rRNA (guanine(527)-N(7))-methyltransferase RsmG, partial [Acidobacteriota bacterium]|nr:16S rRNA (guanine(527)-N(7))-methyltransferase RsmG [Acidobacteriota bacterium]
RTGRMSTSDEIKKLLDGLDLPRNLQKEEQLAAYRNFLEKWNVRINLTASTDWSALKPLFHESLWASKKYPEKTIKHLDIGSGAGFPAIILKIMHPALEIDLVESRGKKAAFLETIIYELGLSTARVHCIRLEEYLGEKANKQWDCVSWKAIKLNDNHILQLKRQVHRDAQLWMFHGRELAVESPEFLLSFFQPLWSEIISGTKESRITVYRPF